MLSREQVIKMKAVENCAKENGVCCKNCKYWFFVQKDQLNYEWGGCNHHSSDNKTFGYAMPVDEKNYCKFFFWKE